MARSRRSGTVAFSWVAWRRLIAGSALDRGGAALAVGGRPARGFGESSTDHDSISAACHRLPSLRQPPCRQGAASSRSCPPPPPWALRRPMHAIFGTCRRRRRLPKALEDAVLARITVLDATRFRAIPRPPDAGPVHLKPASPALPFPTPARERPAVGTAARAARADLARLIGPRSVGCVGIVPQGDDGESAADCWAGSRNLSLFMVSRGWCRPGRSR